MMLAPSLVKNDIKARWLIFSVSAIIFTAVVVLSRVTVNVELGFDVHLFARINAVINSLVSVLLLAGLISVKIKKYKAHRGIMITAMSLSVLFLISYICHHLFAGDTRFGDINHDGILSEAEKAAAGSTRFIYYALLGLHILLAGLILPFILFTAYRGLTAEFPRHKKLARITWPVWFFVALSGVIVYWMIQPYY